MDKSVHWNDAGATTASGSATTRTEAELLELENVYCSHGDTVHYTNPPKIFDHCAGSFMYDAEGREFLDLQMWYSAVNFGYRNPRLNEAALNCRVKGLNIAECCAMQISDLAEFVRSIDDPSVAPLLATLRNTLDSLVEIGLGYLSLDRESATLSGGESQRVKMVRHLGSSLTDITYVFDEPTVGLHPHDIQRMNDLLLRLRDKGNTVLVVEHKPEAIAIADHVVDLGPGAGTAGGEVVFQGTVDELRASGTLTGRHLDDRAAVKQQVRTPTGALEIRGATRHNLQDVDVDVPLGVLTVVTGVAGSGKSSLIHGSVSRREGVVAIDQREHRQIYPQPGWVEHDPMEIWGNTAAVISGALAKAIDAELGGFDKFKEAFAKAATTRFGSGWAWLVRDGGKLAVTSTPNQDTPVMEGGRVLFGNDVWEHAYYLKYQNKRADYLKAWWNVVNWKAVGERYAAAKAGKLTI